MTAQEQGFGRDNEVLKLAGNRSCDAAKRAKVQFGEPGGAAGGEAAQIIQALGRVDVDAPILAAAAPGAGIAFLDEDAGGVLAIDIEAHKQAAIAVALPGPIGAKIDLAGARQHFQPPLGQLAEAALRVALRVMNLRSVDAEQPVTLGANPDVSPSMTAKAETAATVATIGSALMRAAIVDSRLSRTARGDGERGRQPVVASRVRSSWIPSAAAIGAGEDFQEVTVRVLEIDSSAAIVVIDFTRPGFGGIGPIGTPPLSNPSKNFVELSLTHKKGIVLRLYFAVGVHEIDVGAVVSRDHLEGSPFLGSG